MKILSDEIAKFFRKQNFVVVSTVDRYTGAPHSACKGIVNIDDNGRIYLMDLYRNRTHANLKHNPRISITAVDEHKFKGWCLEGKGRIMTGKRLMPDLVKAWEARIATRIARRVIKNMREEKGHKRHPESQLPQPEYMIVMNVESVINLSPGHVK